MREFGKGMSGSKQQTSTPKTADSLEREALANQTPPDPLNELRTTKTAAKTNKIDSDQPLGSGVPENFKKFGNQRAIEDANEQDILSAQMNTPDPDMYAALNPMSALLAEEERANATPEKAVAYKEYDLGVSRYAEEYLSDTDLPASWKSQRDRNIQFVENNPNIARYLLEGNVSSGEFVAAVNFGFADQAANLLMQNTANQARTNRIMSSMSPEMQLLVMALNVEKYRIKLDAEGNVTPVTVNGVPDVLREYEPSSGGGRGRTGGSAPLRQTNLPVGTNQPVTAANAQDAADPGWLKGLKTFWNTSVTVDEDNPLAKAPGFAGDQEIYYGPSGWFDGLFQASDDTQQVIRTLIALTESNPDMTLTDALNPVNSIREAWNSVDEGKYNKVRIEEIREQYGAKNVDLVLELREMAEDGEGDVLARTLIKYQNDPDVLDTIDILFNSFSASSDTEDIFNMVQDIDAASSSSLGNMITGYASNPVTNTVSATVDIAAPIVLDPFLIGGKVIRVTKIARYGLHKIDSDAYGAASPGFLMEKIRDYSPKVTEKKLLKDDDWAIGVFIGPDGQKKINNPALAKALSRPRVQRAFNAFGDQMQRALNTEDRAERGIRMRALKSQWKKYFNSEAIDDMAKNKIFTVEKAYDWFNDWDVVETIVAGGGSRVSPAELLYQAQAATRKPLLPNIGPAGAAWRTQISSKFRYLSINTLSAPMKKSLASLYGGDEALAAANADEVENVIETLRQYPEFVAAIDSDWVVDGVSRASIDAADETVGYVGDIKRGVDGLLAQKVRTWVDNILENSTGAGKGLNRKNRPSLIVNGVDLISGRKINARHGYKKKSGISRRVDRVSRAMARYPDTGMLNISSARDAEKVYRFARGFGLSKVHASYLEETWREASEGQRIVMANGMAKTAAYSRGVPYIINDQAVARTFLDELSATSRAKDRYAPMVRNTRLERDRLNSVVQLGDEVGEEADEPILYSPSEIGENGKEQIALHSWQTSKNIMMPNLMAMERVSARGSLIQMALLTNPWSTTAVNAWSIGTLAGPRYQLRNGLEDFGLYALTGDWGWARRMFVGKEISAAGRESFDQLPGVATQVTSKIPVFRQMVRGFRGPLTKDEIDQVNLANLSLRDGNRDLVANIWTKSLARQRLFFLPTYQILMKKLHMNTPMNKLTGREREVLNDVDDLAQSRYGMSLQQEAAETSINQVNGTNTRFDPVGVAADPSGQAFKTKYINPQFIDVKVSAGNPQAMDAWITSITGILESDGPIGRAAVSRIRMWASNENVQRAQVKARIVELLETSNWGYMTRMGALRDGKLTTDQFAERYLDDVLNTFSKRDGSANERLLGLVGKIDDGDDGITYSVNGIDEAGEVTARIDTYELAQFKQSEMPENILAFSATKIQEVDNFGIQDKIYNAMGNSLNRLTREPIFYANYLAARKEVRWYEKSLENTLVRSGMEPEEAAAFARKRAADMAAERALSTSLSYMDNPNVRSNAAWQLRNVARYYRAQEDFFRRAVRTAQNRPDAIWKGALVYDSIENAGWVWTDEYGDKYFMYPGSRPVMEGLSRVTEILGLGSTLVGGMPLGFSAKVNMLTPSADPNALWPTFSSPLPIIGWKVADQLIKIAPNTYKTMFGDLNLKDIKGEVEPYLFGVYGTDKSFGEMIVPTNWKRVTDVIFSSQFMTEAERLEFVQGEYSMAAKTAMQVMVAAGQVPETLKADGVERGAFVERLDSLAMEIATLRAILGFALPAQPQLTQDNVTDFGREMGTSQFRYAFIELLNLNDGDFDKTLVQWVSLNPALSVFAESKGEAGKRGGQAKFGYFEGTTGTIDWVNENSELIKENPFSASYFAPTGGVSDPSSMQKLVDKGYRVNKSVNTIVNNYFVSQGYRKYSVEKRQYDEAVDGINNNPDLNEADKSLSRRAAKDLWDQTKDQLYASEGGLEDYVSTLRGMGPNERNGYITQYRRSLVALKAKYGTTPLRENPRLDLFEVSEFVLQQYDNAEQMIQDIESDTTISDSRKSARKKDIRGRWEDLVGSNFFIEGYVENESVGRFVEDILSPALGVE